MEAGFTVPYSLDRTKIRPVTQAGRRPLVLVACGSFSPITYLHARMFELARDHAKLATDYEVVGGFLSPVNDSYRKPGLAASTDRVKMCSLAFNSAEDWVSVDSWEARQAEYVPTARVLDHFDQQLNCDPALPKVHVALLAGSDLIQTMTEPGLWASNDIHHILGTYGCFVVQRADSEIDDSLFTSSSVHSRSPLAVYRSKIHMVNQLVRNDISSTQVRLFIRKELSVRYLIDEQVRNYIAENGLYKTPDKQQDFADGEEDNTAM